MNCCSGAVELSWATTWNTGIAREHLECWNMLQNNRNKVILKTDLPVWCLTEYNTNSISHKPSINTALIVVIGISCLSGLIEQSTLSLLYYYYKPNNCSWHSRTFFCILYEPVVLLQQNQNWMATIMTMVSKLTNGCQCTASLIFSGLIVEYRGLIRIAMILDAHLCYIMNDWCCKIASTNCSQHRRGHKFWKKRAW